MTSTPSKATAGHVRIHFQDQGQDFLWWDLEDSGDDYSYRVVDCGPFQSWFWNDHLVAKESVRKGRQPLITKDQVNASKLKYPITKITKRRAAISRATGEA